MSDILEKNRFNGRLYRYNANGVCGFLMPKHVMQKIAKRATKYQNDVREILTEHIDELYDYNWSLAYPNGEQTVVTFAGHPTKERIQSFKPDIPELEDEIYLGAAFSDEAKQIIKAIEERDER